MNVFEYLYVVVAIILTLGLAELLGGVVRILRGDLKSDPLHTLWIVIILQLQLQLAWGLWGLHERPTWRYPEFLLLVTGPIVVYLISALLYPASSSERADVHLLRRRRPFFLLNALYVALTEVYGLVLWDQAWVPMQTLIRIVVIGGLLTVAVSEKRRVQWTVGLLILAGNLWWTLQYSFVAASGAGGR